MDDIFRRFFHFPNIFNDGEDRTFDDEFMGPRRVIIDDQNLPIDDHLNGHPSADELFGNFERHFDHLFKSFFADIQSPIEDLPPPDQSPQLSLRDQMLKSRTERPAVIIKPKNSNDNQRDSDLDIAVSTHGLPAIETIPGQRPPISSGRSSSSFFRTTRIMIDGTESKIEEQRSQWDNAGNEETIITRKLGDKSHRIVTKRDPVGIQEQQDLVNMDENELDEFNKKWTSPVRESRELPTHNQIFGGDPTASTLFQKLFGSFLPLTKPR